MYFFRPKSVATRRFPEQQNNPHWSAVDTENNYSLDRLNDTIFNGSLPETIENPFPYKHTRLRFNDTLVHTPPLMINSISNTLLKQVSKKKITELFRGSFNFFFFNFHDSLNNINENISLSVHPLPYVSPPGGFDPGQFSSAMFIGMLFVLAPSALACEIVLDREVVCCCYNVSCL